MSSIIKPSNGTTQLAVQTYVKLDTILTLYNFKAHTHMFTVKDGTEVIHIGFEYLYDARRDFRSYIKCNTDGTFSWSIQKDSLDYFRATGQGIKEFNEVVRNLVIMPIQHLAGFFRLSVV